ncbi:MAG: trypsin-like peptidase domain-containing protein [Pseudomonadota bacterium]
MSENRIALRTLVLLGIVLGAFALWQAVPVFRAHLVGGEPRAVAARGALAPAEQTVIALFEQARDSVVFISTADRSVNLFTREVFERPRGTGSGFVWDAAGHVVTNHHVVAGADRATVRLVDGRSFRARLVGSDPANDLAVLRIEVDEGRPPPLPIGTSADLQVGQAVLAIGNPFGLDWTLTTGIVSALDRDLRTGRGPVIRGVIQTDAAINPGNSGGPLLDSAGRLIGVNTAIFSPSGSSAGIGFAVPVDTVNRVVPQLIARGRYAPPSLGIGVDRRAQALARRAGIEGVLVLRVPRGSAAARAGLRPARLEPDGRLVPGDVIVAVEGRRTDDLDALEVALSGIAPGASVTVTLRREGREVEVRLPVVAG